MALLSTAVFCGLLSVVPSLRAQDVWIGSTGNWFTGTNWSFASPPTAGQSAHISNGGTARIGSAGATALNLALGQSATQWGNLNIFSSGTLSVGNNLVIGNASSSTLSAAVFQDTASVTTGGNGVIGNAAGSMGQVSLRDSASWTITNNVVVGLTGDG